MRGEKGNFKDIQGCCIFGGVSKPWSGHILEMKGRVRNSLKRATKRTNEKEKGQKEAQKGQKKA